MSNLKGKIAQVIGPVVDVYFEGSVLHQIYDAVVVMRPNGQRVIMETQQHVG